jgi:CRISPR/Cas system-associated protein Csm6
MSHENQTTKYGNLPVGFAIGYENNSINKAYFILHDSVLVPEDSNVAEITEEEYELAIEEITLLENQRKNAELEEAVNTFNKSKDNNQSILWQTITQLQLEIELLKGGNT